MALNLFFTYIFVFLFGLIIGSFLNCVIYRLEQNKSLSGRSFCPKCQHKLSWLDLFPIFSFIFLKGKCRYCKGKISVQYPLVEISTGLIFLLIFNLKFEILNLLVVCFLIIIFVYDFKHYIIPDKVLLPLISVVFIYRLISWEFFTNYLLSAFITFLIFLFIFLVSKGKWMGFGDVKFAFFMGLFLGWPAILVALYIAFFLGGIIGLGLIFLKKKNLKSEVPFGPFLIFGVFSALFWGECLINWYLNFLK